MRILKIRLCNKVQNNLAFGQLYNFINDMKQKESLKKFLIEKDHLDDFIDVIRILEKVIII